LHEIIASEPVALLRYRDHYHLPVNDPGMRALSMPRILADLHLHDIRLGVRALDGTLIVPPTDSSVVPGWDEDTSYLGEATAVNMDAVGLKRFLERESDADEAIADRQDALMAIDDDRLMEMMDQVGGGSWH
jgi:hypothetical protein